MEARALRVISLQGLSPTGCPCLFVILFKGLCFALPPVLLCPHWLAYLPSASRGPTPPQGNPGWPPCFARLFVKGTDQTERQKPQNNTMKTDKNSKTAITREGHLSQSELEQAVPTTNAGESFEVFLVLAQRSSGQVLIEAKTPDEARQNASRLGPHEVDNWEVFEDEMSVESVEIKTAK